MACLELFHIKLHDVVVISFCNGEVTVFRLVDSAFATSMNSSLLSIHSLLRSLRILSLAIFKSLHTCFHLLLYLFSAGHLAILKPRMGENIRDGQPVDGVVTKHGCHEIRELSTVVDVPVFSLVLAPELPTVVFENELVSGIVLLRFIKRPVTRQQIEYDDTQSEQVNRTALVGSPFVNLRRHVVRRSQDCPVPA